MVSTGVLIANKLGIILGIAVIAIVLVTAPMPLVVSFGSPSRTVTIYPNLLFAVPLTLLGVLLLLYGIVVETDSQTRKAVLD